VAAPVNAFIAKTSAAGSPPDRIAIPASIRTKQRVLVHRACAAVSMKRVMHLRNLVVRICRCFGNQRVRREVLGPHQLVPWDPHPLHPSECDSVNPIPAIEEDTSLPIDTAATAVFARQSEAAVSRSDQSQCVVDLPTATTVLDHFRNISRYMWFVQQLRKA